MLLDQRRGNILEVIGQKGFASLQELSETVRASESTVRRDLEYLEKNGQIRRTRGGAAHVGEAALNFDDQRQPTSVEKQKIGRKAAELIGVGETIILDGGTTTLEVARHLAGKSLQVVTNSLPIVNLLLGVSDVEVIFLGGYVYPRTGVALGAMTENALQQVHARRLIMGVGGITQAGLFNTNSLLVEAERQMIAAADEVVVVADCSKLGHTEFTQLATLDEVDRLIVDGRVPDGWRTIAQAHGIELIVAD